MHADCALQYDVELVADAAPVEHVLPALALLVGEALPDLREVALLDVVSLLEKLDVLQQRQQRVLHVRVRPTLHWLSQDHTQDV